MTEAEIRQWAEFVAEPGATEARAEAAPPEWRRRYEAGARVRPRGRRRLGTIIRVVERDGAGAPVRVAVCWDDMHNPGVYVWPIDFLEIVRETEHES